MSPSPSPPPSIITLHRPTARRPSPNTTLSYSHLISSKDNHNSYESIHSDTPLDLSQSRSSVIHGPIHSVDGSSSSIDCLPSTSSSIIPKCEIPSAEWLSKQFTPKLPQFGPAAATVAPMVDIEPSMSMTSATGSTLNGGGSSTCTSNPPRMSYPREFKLVVVNYFNNNGRNKYRTCKKFSITKSMLNGWINKVDKIRESRPGSLKSGRSGRKPQFPDIEKQLFTEYENEVKLSGNKPGNKWIRDRARQLAQERSDSSSTSTDQINCQFSERWLSNFKKRFNIPVGRDNIHPTRESIGESTVSLTSKTDTTNRELIDDEDGMDESVSTPSSSSTIPTIYSSPMKPSTSSSINESIQYNNDDLATELLANIDQLPIQSFYDRFPSLCKKKQNALHRSISPESKRGRRVQFPKVEEILNTRVQSRTKMGLKITNKWLQDEAREIASTVCPSAMEEANKQGRSIFSEHWLSNFKRRFNIQSSNIHTLNDLRSEETPSTSNMTSSTLSTVTTPLTSSSTVSSTCPIHSKSSSFIPIQSSSSNIFSPFSSFTSSIPLGGIPSSRTVSDSSQSNPSPIIDQSSLEWLLLQQSVGQWYF